MRKTIYLAIFFLATILPSNSQELLKEISKAFDNGQPMFIDYLETENLKKVKTEIFNETGKLIFSIKFNPDTGLPDGEFYDLINKGSFKEGVLNCLNCMLVEANSPSVYTYNHNKQNTKITYGDVINGRLVGEVKTYAHYEETYNKVDWNSTRSYIAAGAGLGFRDVKTYTTGKFTKTLVDTKVYNKNGVLDGTVNLSYTAGRYPDEVKLKARLSVKNGIIKSLVSYDEKGVQRDSLSNEQKIWKMNYKYHKNSNDFPIFISIENIIDNNHGLDEENNPYFYNPFYPEYTTEQVIFTLGGKQRFIRYDSYSRYYSYDTGGYKLGLDNNGLYTIRLTGMFDNIIKYDLNEINYYTGFEEYKEHYFLAKGNEKNLLHIIYNTLTNYNKLNKEWVESVWETKHNLKPFYDALTSLTFSDEDYVLNGVRKNLQEFELNKNSFTKYIKYNEEVLKLDQSLTYFFENILLMSDYLRACQESMEKGYTEIQEIWVLNLVTNKYDEIDFKKLIEIAENKEKEAKINSDVNQFEGKSTNIFSNFLKKNIGRYDCKISHQVLMDGKYKIKSISNGYLFIQNKSIIFGKGQDELTIRKLLSEEINDSQKQYIYRTDYGYIEIDFSFTYVAFYNSDNSEVYVYHTNK